MRPYFERKPRLVISRDPSAQTRTVTVWRYDARGQSDKVMEADNPSLPRLRAYLMNEWPDHYVTG